METSDQAIKPSLRNLTTSATLAINEQVAEMRAAGQEVYRLGFGQSPFPVPEVVIESLRRHAGEKDYLPVRGLPALREAVAAYHRRRNGFECSPESVIIGPGSKELIFISQMVTSADLLLPSPSWVSYAPQATVAQNRVQWLETRRANRWKLDPRTLESAAAERQEHSLVLLLNYPCNPTGYTYGADELSALAETARRHRIVIISDEIYGELEYSGSHRSIAEFYPERTIVTGGLSKWCGAGGWRLGTAIFPPALQDFADVVGALGSETYSSASTPIQYAAVDAYRGGPEIDDYLAHCRRILKAVGVSCAKRLRDIGLVIEDPDGGFYLFPRIDRPARNRFDGSMSMCRSLLEDTGVAVLPGLAFGRPPAELSFRMAFVDFDGAEALNVAGRSHGELGNAFFEAVCPNIDTALTLLTTWIGQELGAVAG